MQELHFDTFDKLRLVFSETFSENNAGEGLLIRKWTSLDREGPDNFLLV